MKKNNTKAIRVKGAVTWGTRCIKMELAANRDPPWPAACPLSLTDPAIANRKHISTYVINSMYVVCFSSNLISYTFFYQKKKKEATYSFHTWRI